MFKAGNNNYYYDTGTNKILSCDIDVFNLLNDIYLYGVEKGCKKQIAEQGEFKFNKAVNNIFDAVEKEKVLLVTGKMVKFNKGRHFTGVESLLRDRMDQIILEVTDSCNFRCKYCVYSEYNAKQRSHGKNFMSLNDAQRAVDYLVSHSTKNNRIAVSFYGGEPLLNFEVIKHTVNYIKTQSLSLNVHYSITTNGSLLNEKIIDFLFSNNFSVLVSIDGPEEAHNSNRIDVYGKPTYSKVIANLKKLYDKYDGKRNLLGISMVYAPPYSENKLNAILSLWNDNPWFNKLNGSINITYPGSETLSNKIYDNKDLLEDKTLTDWCEEIYIDNYIKDKTQPKLIKSIIDKKLGVMLKREQYSEPDPGIYLNGNCIPGQRKVYVNVKGELHVCEKVQGSPSIGNLDQGIDLNIINNIYVNEYASKGIKYCQYCWANKMCSICYASAYKGGNIDMNNKNRMCYDARNNAERQLKLFSYLLEINPKGLNYLADYETN